MRDFRDGKRHSSDPRKNNTNRMAAFAKAMTDEEIQAAAEYFAKIAYNTPWIRVVESTTVPKTHISVGLFLAEEGAEKEPIGNRLIEVPISAEATENLRDPHSGFIAYVPPGSLKKGQALAEGCATCHGPELRGMGPVPPIAGRSPSYMVRQMYDMRSGARNGSWTELMKPVVAKMSDEDLRNVAAWVASLKP
jgi:cytochrome c553